MAIEMVGKSPVLSHEPRTVAVVDVTADARQLVVQPLR